MSHPPRRCCVACGRDDAKPLFRDLVACANCGLVYFPWRLTPREVARLYGENYFKGAEYFDYPVDRAVHEANFRNYLRRLGRWLPAGGRLFEIGCAYGYFLRLAGRRWRVSGCDIAAEPCRHARDVLGQEVYCGDFEEVPLKPGRVDLFCLWDTIEHLEDPGRYLRRIAELLHPGGVLALSTGDLGSRLARWQGPRWRQIHPPTHLWYFTPATMRRTLERFGFEAAWTGHPGLWRSVGQIVYSLTSLNRPRPSALHRLCMKLGLGRLGIYLNTFDHMMVVARRTAARPAVIERAAA